MSRPKKHQKQIVVPGEPARPWPPADNERESCERESPRQNREDCLASLSELEVANVLADLAENSEIKADVAPIRITGALERTVAGEDGKNVIIVAFPYRIFMDDVQKIHTRLIGEMEKKLRKHVIFYAKRRVMEKRFARSAGFKVLPYSRTLTAVHDALLEDIVGPTEIVGKRTRVRVDGSRVYKVFLDPKDKNKENIEEKLDAFSAAYKCLTNKTAIFSFEI